MFQEEPFPPEPARSRKRQATAMKSRVNREVQARFCEGLGVKFPGATRPDSFALAESRGPRCTWGAGGGGGVLGVAGGALLVGLGGCGRGVLGECRRPRGG